MVRTSFAQMKSAVRKITNTFSSSSRSSLQIVIYVSFRTSLMQLGRNINFPASLLKSFDQLHFQLNSSDVDVEENFFLHICGKKRLDCNLQLKRENQQTALSVFIQHCAEKVKINKTGRKVLN